MQTDALVLCCTMLHPRCCTVAILNPSFTNFWRKLSNTHHVKIYTEILIGRQIETFEKTQMGCNYKNTLFGVQMFGRVHHSLLPSLLLRTDCQKVLHITIDADCQKVLHITIDAQGGDGVGVG